MDELANIHVQLTVQETYSDQDASNVWIEAVRVVVAIFDHQAILGGLERTSHMGVYPERPECIVQVKDHDLRQWKAIAKGCWCGDFGGWRRDGRAVVACLDCLVRLSNHDDRC
jgi:hypothetical protein